MISALAKHRSTRPLGTVLPAKQNPEENILPNHSENYSIVIPSVPRPPHRRSVLFDGYRILAVYNQEMFPTFTLDSRNPFENCDPLMPWNLLHNAKKEKEHFE
jgi:hypothetical protein